MKYKKIAIIGMMGSGKTTIANMLAKDFNKNAIDLDFLFEEKYKTTIRDFFHNFGEDKFRSLEHNLLEEIMKKDEFILSTGGGVILSQKNRNLLFQDDILTIYLSATADTIYDRIKDDTTRPLLLVENPKSEIKNILDKRIKYYSMAKIKITTDNKTCYEIVEEVKKWIV